MSGTSPARGAGRPSGSTAKGEATRRHILDTSAAVFARVGYDRARMAELIDATGLTKGAVYFHFDSKEALAIAVLEAKHVEWLTEVRQRLEQFPPGRDRLTHLCAAMIELHRPDTTTWAIARLTQNLTAIASTRARAANLTREWVAFVAELIREAKELGHSPQDLDPAAVAVTLVGAFDGVKSIHDVLSGTGEEHFASSSAILQAMSLDYRLVDGEHRDRVPDSSPP